MGSSHRWRKGVTPLSLDAPLSSLLDVLVDAGAVDGVRALAKLHGATETRLQAVRRAGPRIKLATLAAYARAAGYKLWAILQDPSTSMPGCQCEGATRVDCNWCAGELPAAVCWCHIGEPRDYDLTYPPTTAAENHGATVADARALAERWGFVMVLAVEPVERSEGR